MGVLEWILNILLFIVALAVLIAIHELGHLTVAKIFNVYCYEYAIGFGPKLFSKKRKNGETKFTLRAIPFGGFVAMAGEDDAQYDPTIVVPPERTLGGIRAWKKVCIMLAGVTMNALLALLLFAISNLCFPVSAVSMYSEVTENSQAYTLGVRENDKLWTLGPDSLETDTTNPRVIYEEYTVDGVLHAAQFFILDDSVTIGSYEYVAAYTPQTTKGSNNLSKCLIFFPVDTTGEIKEMASFKLWTERGVVLTNYPDFRKGTYILNEEVTATIELSFAKYHEEVLPSGSHYEDPVLMNFNLKSIRSGSDFVWEDLGVSLKTINYWLTPGERIKGVFTDFGSAATAVFRGLGILFSGGIKNMSGIIGIAQTSATIMSNYSFSYYLYFWGLISVNLAIFNLLPFPGLDGWQIVVTVVEGITKKKMPTKVKSIVSFIGLALVFGLMILVLVFDILRIAGLM